VEHSQSVADILSAESRRGALALPEHRLEALAEAMEWLAPKAFRFGLTNYDDPRDFAASLVAPLLVLLQESASACVQSPALDFGAGSGAVGLALAVLRPDLQLILADRRARVVQFLDLCSRRLQLANCTALLSDLADPPPGVVAAIGTVLSRAFGPTPVALTHASRLVRPGGCIALWHQPPAPPSPVNLRPAGTLATSVPSLALTLYRRGI
jgi:16S rRNA G527 N7-methylase RsmG